MNLLVDTSGRSWAMRRVASPDLPEARGLVSALAGVARALLASTVLLGCGCASSASELFGGEAGDASVILVVRNESSSTMQAFVQWEGGNPSRLGEIPAGETRTFVPPFRGAGVRVFFEGLGRSPSNRREPPFYGVRRRDEIEWVLLPNGSIFYRRLEDLMGS